MSKEKSHPEGANDAGGTNWEKHFDQLMQVLMRNNGSCICKDIFGNVIPRNKDGDELHK